MSTKRFSFTKGIVALVLTLVAILGLVACETPANPDKEAVEAALDQVALVYGQGDSASSVTRNLTLPTALGEITISWASSNAAVISNAGVVTRPNADTVVTLTATLTLREESDTVVFSLTVKAAEAAATPEEALAALQIFSSTLVYNESTGRYTTTSDLFLPTRSMKLDITWSSPNTAVIDNVGKVVRPAWGQSDQTVILVASVGDATREFIITVPAINVKPNNIAVAEAKDALLLAGIGNGVAADLVLPTTVGSDGVTVTWSSNNPEVISNEGVVVRQQENVTVTLTATLTKGTASDTKTFDVVVLSFAPFTEVASIQAAIDLSIANRKLSPAPDTYAKIEAVTVVGISGDGYMIYDGASLLFVFTSGTPAESIKVGDVYDITGFVDYYFGSWQFNGTKSAEMPTILKASTEPAKVLEPQALPGTIVQYVASLPTTYTQEAPFPYAYVEFEGKVRVQGTGNYDVFLVDFNYAGSGINSNANSPHTTDALMIYYKSNIDALRQFDGLKVKFSAFLYSYRTDRTIFTFIFTGVAADIEVLPMTDQESVDAAKVQAIAGLPAIQETAATLTLPTDLLGTTIVWTSSDNALINPTTGVVTPVEGSQTAVTLTATITKGSASGVQTFVVKVGQIPLSTVQQVVDAPVNSTVYRVQGTVTASEYYRTYFIQQGDAGIAIYTSDATMLALLKANVGKDVEVIGTRGAFNGLRQMAPQSVKALGTTGTVTAVNVDAVALNATDMLPYQGRLVTLTQLKVTNRAVDQYNNVTLTLTQVATGRTILMKWDSRLALSTAAATLLGTLTVGKEISVTNVMAWLNNPYLYFTDSTIVTEVAITDASKVAGDKAALSLPAEVKTATPLTLPATGANGAAITWATDNAAVITAAGVVALPASGTVTVKLTATLTLGSVTETREFNIVVGLSDQDLVDADAAALVVVAAHTAPTTITLPATGSNGSAIVWTSSNNALIDPATGAVVMPQSGQVVVTLTATLSLNAATKVQTFEVTLGTTSEPQAEVLRTYVFGTAAVTGYSAGSLAWTETFGAQSELKDRVQINTSTSAPHTAGNPFLVLAPIQTFKVAFVEFSLAALNVSNITFQYSSWSGSAATNAVALTDGVFTLQKWNATSSTWENVEYAAGQFNLLSSVVSTEYKTASFNVVGGGLFRLYYTQPSATSTSNTFYALTVDNFVVSGFAA